MMKIYFDDLTLAYKTLSNKDSRAEYDEYISQQQSVSNYWNMNRKAEEDPEVIAERERRQRERGKKRYEEDYSFINQEFFNSWRNRTQADTNPGKDGGVMFDGDDIEVGLEVTLA
jgi:DnaJ-class molecular chaperone